MLVFQRIKVSNVAATPTAVRIRDKNNELLDFFIINSFYTNEIPFQYCYSKNGNRVSDEVMKNRLIEYAKKNRFSCGG